MSTKWKNAAGIALIALIVAAIVAGVTVAAIDNKKIGPSVEYFIDEAPVDYSADENVVYVRRFRDAIENYFPFSSDGIPLAAFADRLLHAASLARVPAEKLDGIATAIKKAAPSEWGEDLLSLDEESLKRIAGTSTPSLARKLLREFVELSGLSTVECADFLYEYLRLYGAERYVEALNAVGKDRFTDLVGGSLFIILRSEDAGNSGSSTTALRTAVNEYGEILLDSFSAGADLFATVYGLRMDKFPAPVNDLLSYINGKTPYVFAFLGAIATKLGTDSVRRALEGGYDDSVLPYRVLAADIQAGAERFLTEWGEDLGVADLDEASDLFTQYAIDLYSGYYLSLGFDLDSAEVKENLRSKRDRYVKFFHALSVLIEKKTEEEYSSVVGDFRTFKEELTSLTEGFLYLWIVQRIGELNKEGV